LEEKKKRKRKNFKVMSFPLRRKRVQRKVLRLKRKMKKNA